MARPAPVLSPVVPLCRSVAVRAGVEFVLARLGFRPGEGRHEFWGRMFGGQFLVYFCLGVKELVKEIVKENVWFSLGNKQSAHLFTD